MDGARGHSNGQGVYAPALRLGDCNKALGGSVPTCLCGSIGTSTSHQSSPIACETSTMNSYSGINRRAPRLLSEQCATTSGSPSVTPQRAQYEGSSYRMDQTAPV
jgi:hypothetical protein